MGLKYEDAMALARRMAEENEGPFTREYFKGTHPMTTDYERGFRDAMEKAAKVAQDLPVLLYLADASDTNKTANSAARAGQLHAKAELEISIRALAPADDGTTVRVPKEPTPEMIYAAHKVANQWHTPDMTVAIYRAMIAALTESKPPG